MPWLVPQRWGFAEILLFGAEQQKEDVDDAAQRLESRLKPFYHSVQRQDDRGLTQPHYTKLCNPPNYTTSMQRKVGQQYTL